MLNTLHRSLETLFRELIDGPDANAAWILNGQDVGLLRSLDKLTASAASAAPAGLWPHHMAAAMATPQSPPVRDRGPPA